MATREKTPVSPPDTGETLLREALAFILPEGKASALAQKLLRTFCRLDSLFSAPEEELRQVVGVDENAARYLRLTAQLARAYIAAQTDPGMPLMDAAGAADLLKPLFLGRRVEIVCAIFLDNQSRPLLTEQLCEGAITTVPLYVRRLVKMCVDLDAQHVILAHNHTSGSPMPSKEDIFSTGDLALALSSIGASLSDHLIFSADKLYSFSKSGLLREIHEELLMGKKSSLALAREEERLMAGNHQGLMDLVWDWPENNRKGKSYGF